MSKIWPFTFNVLLFGGIAFIGPFIVLYYESLGFTGTEIGLLTGITPLIMLFGAPLWTGVADFTHKHRLMMSVATFGTALAIFALPFVNQFAPVLILTMLFAAFFAPVTAFADSATLNMLGKEIEKYGRVRLGGTIGFGVAAAVAGAVVQQYGLKVSFLASSFFFVLAGLVSQKFVRSQQKTGVSAGGQVRALLSNRRWLPFLTIALAGGLAGAVINNYLLPFMQELGATESRMGLALTIGTFSEVPVLLVSNRLIGRFKPYRLLVLSLVITGVRLLLFAASGNPDLILILQVFNGLTFITMWVAGVSYAAENAPPGMGSTVQGLFASMIFGFGGAVGGFLGGPLLVNAGGRSLYFIFGILVLITIAIAVLMQARLPVERKPSLNVTGD